MLKYAQVTDGYVSNIGVFDDGSDLPDGWIDVTGQFVDIGYPVVDGKAVLKPSDFHTVTADGTGWELTPENSATLEARETERNRVNEFWQARKDSELQGATVAQVEAWLNDQIDPASDLDELKTAVKTIAIELAIFLV